MIDRPTRVGVEGRTCGASMAFGSIAAGIVCVGDTGSVATVSSCTVEREGDRVGARPFEGASGAATAVAVALSESDEEPSDSSPWDFFLVARGFLLFTFSTSTCSVVSIAVPVEAVLNHSRMVASSPGPTVDMCPLMLGTSSAMHLSTIALLSMPSSFAIWEIRLAKFNSRTNHRLDPTFDTPTILQFGLRGPRSVSRLTHAPRIFDA